jgi:hypothetical protein
MARALTDNLLNHIISKFKQLQGTNQLVLTGRIYHFLLKVIKFYPVSNTLRIQTHLPRVIEHSSPKKQGNKQLFSFPTATPTFEALISKR